MEYQFDPAKAQANLEKHGVSFDAADAFDWDSAIVRQDDRFDYGETRYQALGLIGGRVHFMYFTVRGTTIRIIGLRKANEREIASYDKT